MSTNYIMGAKRDKKDKRDLRIKGILAPIEIPKQIYIIDDPFGSKNQDGLGSCTAQAQAHHKERQEGLRCSARFIMALSKQMEGNTGYGGYPRNSFKVVNKVGVCKEDLYPEPKPNSMTWEEYIDTTKISQEAINDAANHKSQSYWRLSNDIDEIRRTLVTYKNSVNMSMEWRSGYNHPGLDGTLPYCFGDGEGHEVDIKGFDDFTEALICKNSWSEGWGVLGDFKIPYSLFPKVVWDLWCSLDIPNNMPVDNNYGNPEDFSWVNGWRKTYITAKFLLKYKRIPTKRELTALLWYWSYDDVVEGTHGNLWLTYTFFDAKQKGLI